MVPHHRQSDYWHVPGAIQDLAKGWPPASEAKSCQCSEVGSSKESKPFVTGVQGLLKGPGSFWVFNAQIYAFSHILDTLLLSFLQLVQQPKN